jgi:hypothetical protein
MANVSLHQLLGTTVVTRAISRIKTPMSRLQQFFGMQPGGPAVNPVGGSMAGYDIFDRTRRIATGRPPFAGPANRAPQAIGHITLQMYRTHEKILLHEAKLFRTRPVGGNFGDVDSRGQRYVTQQEAYLAQLFKNHREFMVSRMLRGQFYVKLDGDDWIPTDTSGADRMTVDFRIPAANKGKLPSFSSDVVGDVITATWSNAGTDILLHLLNINAAFEEHHGYPLRHAWCPSQVWNAIMANTKIQTVGGSANTVFTTFQPTGLTNEEGIADTGFTAVLRAVPWLTWHVYDAGLEVDGTYTKFLPNDRCVLLPEPSPDIFEFYEGSEIVAENVMDPGSERMGLSAWTTRVIDPAGFELKALDIGMPVPYIPKAIVYAQVIF